jgi:hypothetical protein
MDESPLFERHFLKTRQAENVTFLDGRCYLCLEKLLTAGSTGRTGRWKSSFMRRASSAPLLFAACSQVHDKHGSPNLRMMFTLIGEFPQLLYLPI